MATASNSCISWAGGVEVFREDQIERYSRHIILKEVGGKGQKKLLDGKVLIIGAGGLGAPIALYLAAAGVGTIGIADADAVDITNLQRQVIHFTPDIGKPKVLSAKEKMESDRLVASVLLCWKPTLKLTLRFGSKTRATPAPLVESPKVGLFTRASLTNCEVSSFAPAFRSK